MRRRRPVLVIAFSSTEQALAAEALFTNSGLPGRMIPIPSQVSAGCGLAWKAEVDEGRSSLRLWRRQAAATKRTRSSKCTADKWRQT